MFDLHSSPVSAGYFKAALACLAATALTLPLRGVVDAANIVMIFLLVVALVAVRLGSGPATSHRPTWRRPMASRSPAP